MKLDVVQWNDVQIDYNNNNNIMMQQGGGGGFDAGGGGGGMYLPYQSQLNSFEEFLVAGSVGVTSLDVGNDYDDDDDDDDSMGMSMMLNNEGGKKKKGAKSLGDDGHDDTVGSLILIEEVSCVFIYSLMIVVYFV